MQRSGGGGSSGRQRAAEDWSETARRAAVRAQAGPGGTKIKCPGNLLLYFFLVELKADMAAADSERHKHVMWGLQQAKAALLEEPCRVATRAHLTALKGCKDMLANIIERHLWSLHPPDELDEEEQELRAARDAAAAAEKKAADAAKRAEKKQQKQQAAAAAAPPPGSSGGSFGGSSGGGGFSGGAAGDAFRQPGVAAHDPLAELQRILRRDPKAASLMGEVQRQAAAAAAAAAAGAGGSGGSSFGGAAAAAAAAAAGASGSGSAAAAAAAAGGGKQRVGSAGRKRTTAAAASTADAWEGGEGEGGSQQQQAAAAAAAAAGAPKAKKKRVTAPKEYVPAVGSANYAFVITLYLRHCTGNHHLSKEELLSAAESSRLADTPLRGNTNGWAAQRGPGKWYDGWSCVKTLENRDVPLIQRWSNPVKIRLTAAGMALGARLYKHATDSGKMAPHPDVHPDTPPAPGSPTAAAAADLSAAAAAAAAAKEAAAATAKKPRQRKAAAAAAAAGGDAPAGSQQQQQQQPDLSGLDPSVAAALAAVQAATDSAAQLGVVVDPPPPAAAAAAWWGDDDPCMAADGFWNPPDPAAAAAAAGGGGTQRRRRKPTAAAAAAGGDDDCPVVISDDEDCETDRGADSPAAAAAAGGGGGVGGGGGRGGGAGAAGQQGAGVPSSQRQRRSSSSDGSGEGWGQQQQQQQGSDGEQDDVASVIDDIIEGEVTLLVDMGFDRVLATKALRHTSGSLEAAITLLTDTPELLDTLTQSQQQTQQTQQTQTQPGPSQPTQQSAAGGRQQQQQQPSQPYGSQQPSQQQQGSQPAAAAAAAGHRKPPRPENLHRKASTAAAAAAAAAGPSRQGSGFSGGPSRQGSAAASSSGLGAQDSGVSGGSSRGTAAMAAAAAAAAEDGGYIGLDMEQARPWQAPLLGQELSLPLPPLAAGAQFDSAYDVVLLVDQREQYSRAGGPGARTLDRTESLRKHAGAIAAQGVRVDSAITLPCGDVAWVAEHRVTKQRYLLDFLAERKSYADLSSSIIDGRYTAQKWLMAGQDAARTCFYILEGNPAELNAHGQDTSSKQQACVTALHRMLLHDGFKVLETSGPQDTVDLLASITQVLMEVYAPRTNGSSSSSGQQQQQQQQVAATLDAWKAGITTSRRTKTVRQKWQELLLSVAGIGEEAVCAVVAAYPTPISLYRAYETTIRAALAQGPGGQHAVAAARGLLADLAQGSGQRLGPAKAAVVYDRLFANGWNLAPGGL